MTGVLELGVGVGLPEEDGVVPTVGDEVEPRCGVADVDGLGVAVGDWVTFGVTDGDRDWWPTVGEVAGVVGDTGVPPWAGDW